MLNIIERELVRKYYFLLRPFTLGGRKAAFSTTEAAGPDLSSWDESNNILRDVNSYQSVSKVHAFINMHQSKGSHVVDVDGNILLDLCSTESLPLGHNHDAFISVSTAKRSNQILYRKSRATVTWTCRLSMQT